MLTAQNTPADQSAHASNASAVEHTPQASSAEKGTHHPHVEKVDFGALRRQSHAQTMEAIGNVFDDACLNEGWDWMQESIDDLVSNLAHVANKEQVGSSRVDLQACKLEYSIVSPK